MEQAVVDGPPAMAVSSRGEAKNCAAVQLRHLADTLGACSHCVVHLCTPCVQQAARLLLVRWSHVLAASLGCLSVVLVRFACGHMRQGTVAFNFSFIVQQAWYYNSSRPCSTELLLQHHTYLHVLALGWPDRAALSDELTPQLGAVEEC